MADVDGGTLMMAIQAVEDAMDALQAAIEDAGADASPDDQEMLLAYWKSSRKLETAYEAERLNAANLPAYALLVRRPRVSGSFKT